MKYLALVLVLLVAGSAAAAPSSSSCSVSPAIVPMESTYTISVSGFTPNTSVGLTIRQTGQGSYTKGIGSHPNASVTTGPDGSGSVELVAHGIETYTNPRLVLNPDAGTVQVHAEGAGRANCSFEVVP